MPKTPTVKPTTAQRLTSKPTTIRPATGYRVTAKPSTNRPTTISRVKPKPPTVKPTVTSISPSKIPSNVVIQARLKNALEIGLAKQYGERNSSVMPKRLTTHRSDGKWVKSVTKHLESINGLGKITGQFDAVNPGSLRNDLAVTFAGGRYSEMILEADTVFYRAGIEGKPLGEFFSAEAPNGILQTRIDKAVRPVWANGGESPINVAFGIKIPAGTKVFTGIVAAQGGMFVGGTTQIVVPKPWLIEGVEQISTIPLR